MLVKLDDAFDLQMGRTPSRDNSDYWRGCNKWVSIADMSCSGKYISCTKECITDKGVLESGIKPVPANTVIMSFKLSIGKVTITAEPMYTNEAIMAFIDKGKYDIDANYIYYLFRSIDWMGGSNFAAKGVTLNKTLLSERKIELPRIEIQRQIATVLRGKIDTIDALAEKTERQIKDVEAYIERRITDFLIDKKKSDWTTGTVNDFSTINPSVREMTDRPEDDYLVSFVPMTAVSAEEGKITEQIIKPYAEVKKGYTYFVEGDIIFAKITPCMQNGKIAVARDLNNGIGFGSTEFHVIRANEQVIPEWLYYLFRRKSYLETAATKMQGAVGQQRLPDTFIRETEAAFPRSVDEQKEIINALSEEVNHCAKLIKDLRKQQENITALRECVFKEAFGNEE
ncbi:MAG: Type I restriction modification DNA specificity domain protein [Pelotomaculum sp. PtaU1.Bin065]|nr:MAG: Type I restriction modification DNA specificity domain protein [Pelotomaculum sp. PtaU1.Bin065]